jgi:hypothetical protein
MALYISKQMNGLFSLKQFSFVFFLQHETSSETVRTWEINESKLVSGRILSFPSSKGFGGSKVQLFLG